MSPQASTRNNSPPPPIDDDQTAALSVRRRLGAPDLMEVEPMDEQAKNKDLFVDNGLDFGTFSANPVGVKVTKKKEALDLESGDEVVKRVAAAVAGPLMSPEEVASVGAFSGSSGSADETDSKSTRGGKDSLKTKEVVLMVDDRKALQDEIADMALKLEVAQREIESMRLEIDCQKADLIRPLGDRVLNEQVEKENNEKLEIEKNVDDVLLVEPELIVAAERVGEMDDGDVLRFLVVVKKLRKRRRL